MCGGGEEECVCVWERGRVYVCVRVCRRERKSVFGGGGEEECVCVGGRGEECVCEGGGV